MVKYIYRGSNGKFGWYQCDKADLKQFLRSYKEHGVLYWVVAVYEEQVWIWSACNRRWYRARNNAVPWWAR